MFFIYLLVFQPENSLEKTACVSSKIIGDAHRDIIKFCEKQVLRKSHSVLVNGSLVLYPMFETISSGRRFRCPTHQTNHKESSFIPVAIILHILNSAHLNEM